MLTTEQARKIWYDAALTIPKLEAACSRINENSPICARDTPDRKAVCSRNPPCHHCNCCDRSFSDHY